MRKQVVSILHNNGLAYSTIDDELVLRFSSAVVHLSFPMLGEQKLIQLRSTVLSGVSTPDAPTQTILGEMNRLNRVSIFGKWVFYPDEQLVVLEYDLLGDHLQEDELMTALAMIARLADTHDDQLQRILGGQKAFE